MLKVELSIVNKLGLHARAAAKFVNLSKSFACDITIIKDNQEVDGKSIMSVMLLAASLGTQIVLVTDGSDEEAAATAIADLVANRFDEAE